MLVDPLVGFLPVHEAAHFTPDPQGSGRKIEIAGPCGDALIHRYSPKVLIRPQRLIQRPLADERGKVHFPFKAIIENNADPATVQRADRAHLFFKVVFHFNPGENGTSESRMPAGMWQPESAWLAEGPNSERSV